MSAVSDQFTLGTGTSDINQPFPHSIFEFKTTDLDVRVGVPLPPYVPDLWVPAPPSSHDQILEYDLVIVHERWDLGDQADGIPPLPQLYDLDGAVTSTDAEALSQLARRLWGLVAEPPPDTSLQPRLQLRTVELLRQIVHLPNSTLDQFQARLPLWEEAGIPTDFEWMRMPYLQLYFDTIWIELLRIGDPLHEEDTKNHYPRHGASVQEWTNTMALFARWIDCAWHDPEIRAWQLKKRDEIDPSAPWTHPPFFWGFGGLALSWIRNVLENADITTKTLNVNLSWTCAWLLYAGDWLYGYTHEKAGNMASSRTLSIDFLTDVGEDDEIRERHELWTGPDGHLEERWLFWKERLEELKDRDDLDENARGWAKVAWERMRQVQEEHS